MRREGFQRATAKPFGRARRHETPLKGAYIKGISLPVGSDQGFAVALDLRSASLTDNLKLNDFTLAPGNPSTAAGEGFPSGGVQKSFI